MPNRILTRAVALSLAVLAAASCADEPGPTGPEAPLAMAEVDAEAAALTDLVTLNVGGTELTFWPYTGRTPTLGDAADPINLILHGDADPRVLRTRLMALSGDRSAFGLPNVFPFDCTWTDAQGGTQSVYAEETGWSGSVIQLQCGDYESIRYHLRLFRVGGVTLANAHMDVLIPGTPDHDVISWELPQFLATVDFMRIGASATQSSVITQAPTYRSILGLVFLGLPGELRDLLTGQVPGIPATVTADGALINDGSASVLEVPSAPEDGDGTVISRQTIDIDFDQTIPRPFCDGDGQDFLKVEGPVTLDRQVIQTAGGTYVFRYHAKGHLDVMQVAPEVSEPYRALVNQHGRGVMTDTKDMVNDIQLRMEIRPGGGERGQLLLNVRIGPDGAGEVGASVSCKS